MGVGVMVGGSGVERYGGFGYLAAILFLFLFLLTSVMTSDR